MKDLPEIYARVVAKRPELAVVHEGRTLYHFPGLEGWGLQHPRTKTIAALAEYREFNDICASALILARWVEGLPQGYFIAKTCSGFDVAVIDNYACVHWSDRPAFDHPVDALAAFYLGEQP